MGAPPLTLPAAVLYHPINNHPFATIRTPRAAGPATAKPQLH
jgi:hypothetical protein